MVKPNLDLSVVVAAPGGRILRAFFDPAALSVWWGAARSVTTARTLGAYAIEWPATEFKDEVLGRLGGVFRGTVMEFVAGSRFLVAEAFWLPPDGDPIGPMVLEVSVKPEGNETTRVRVTQNGFEESDRWRRYYEVVELGWEHALVSLKHLLEK